jgi:FKBP-type peptidyl-prolyl cis-trans isomerase
MRLLASTYNNILNTEETMIGKRFITLLILWGVFAMTSGGAQTDNSSPTKVEGKSKKTSSGLEYWDIKVGSGETAKAGKPVTVHYTGWLTNGKKFDSSVDRGQPFVFPLGGGKVIKGWDEGVAGMKVGGKRQLHIPPELGYGDKNIGNGLIPPNSTMIFDVELLGVGK